MVYPYNVMQLSYLKEWSTDIQYCIHKFQNIMLTERNQAQKSIYFTIPFIRYPNIEKTNILWYKSESCWE